MYVYVYKSFFPSVLFQLEYSRAARDFSRMHAVVPKRLVQTTLLCCDLCQRVRRLVDPCGLMLLLLLLLLRWPLRLRGAAPAAADSAAAAAAAVTPGTTPVARQQQQQQEKCSTTIYMAAR